MEENNTTAAEAQEEPTTEEAVETTAEAPEESATDAATETAAEETTEPATEAETEPTAEVEEEPTAEAEEESAAEAEEEPAADEESGAESVDEEPTAESVVATPSSIEEITPKSKLAGKVSRLELYGAFIDVGVGTNALIHISKLGKAHVNRVSDVLSVGDEVTVWVDKVNPEQGQIMVTMIEPLEVEWGDLKKGQTYTGTITRLENYGAFVDIGAEREGLVHISEISHDYVNNPSELLSVGDEVQVQVLDFNRRKRRIDLSIKNLLEKPESESAAATVVDFDDAADLEEELEEVPTAMEVALRKAMGDEPIDSIEGQSRRKRKKGRRRRGRRRDQDDLLDRTLHFEYDA